MSGRATRWAHGVVIDWTLRVTRGLPEEVARDRFDEIASDLWEQEHASRARDLPLAAALLLRALRGVTADLSWRHAVRSAARSPQREPQKVLRPLTAEGRPFDQTNGALATDDRAPHDAFDAERHLVDKAVAATLMGGWTSGGGVG